jgi:hypothetical protein
MIHLRLRRQATFRVEMANKAAKGKLEIQIWVLNVVRQGKPEIGKRRLVQRSEESKMRAERAALIVLQR